MPLVTADEYGLNNRVKALEERVKKLEDELARLRNATMRALSAELNRKEYDIWKYFRNI